MSSKQSGPKFPTHLFHGALLAVVLSLAVFRFFVQGEPERFDGWSFSGYCTLAVRSKGAAAKWKDAPAQAIPRTWSSRLAERDARRLKGERALRHGRGGSFAPLLVL